MALFLSYLNFAVVLLISFLVLRAIYRLTLHPLARFPGPYIAGATSAYQAWFDLKTSTSYVKKFPALHQKYGPVVRITPNQLHIHDMNAYNEWAYTWLACAKMELTGYRIFKVGSRFGKLRDNYSNEASNGFFNVLDPKAVKPWRDPYQPYFSKAAISRLEPLIHNRINKFLSGLKVAASTGMPVDLSMGYRSLTSDVVTSYMFADRGFDLLDAEGFQSPILLALEEFFNIAQYVLYFPNFMFWLTRQLRRLTRDQTQMLFPALAATNWISEQCAMKVQDIIESKGSGSSLPTVFDAFAKPDEKRKFTPNLRQLTADAFTFHGAGTDTTAHALTMGTWYLINDTVSLAKLRHELREAIAEPNSEKLVSSSVLEHLPYLHAVVKESLRLSMGVPGRMARVVPEGGAVLCGKNVPAGTSISSVTYCYHMDPHHFPSPEIFRPERWLGPDATQLENKLVTFSRGPRSCIGLNLAYAELYLNFAYVFRKFDLKAYKTTRESMEWKDNFVVTTKEHLRVTLTKVDW